MQTVFTRQDWKQFEKNYGELMRWNAIKKKENNNEDYLWDTFKMATKIKNNMRLTNGCSNFEDFHSPTLYMSMKLKLIEDENIQKLLQDFYLYDECNYNAIVYGKKMIEHCNANYDSYIEAIFRLAEENIDGFYESYKFPHTRLYTYGSKMRFAKLDENGQIYYDKPEEKPISKKDLMELHKKRLKEILGDDYDED